MKTEALIAELARQATPVRRLPPPLTRAALWVVVAVASAVAGLLLFGPRPDVAALVRQFSFAWPIAIALVTLLTAGTAALTLAVPGATHARVWRAVAVASLVGWTIASIAVVVREGHGLHAAADWPICFLRVILIALLPSMVLTVMLRRAAPLSVRWTAALATSASMAAGALAIQVICPIDAASHALLGHVGPVLALSVIAAWNARRILGLGPS